MNKLALKIKVDNSQIESDNGILLVNTSEYLSMVSRSKIGATR
ncbi:MULTISPECIES: hypothetical protein [unclassified Enterococcus]|nr:MULTISPECIES: hypothetical protein [unclassified Enterococcus]